MQCNTWDEQSKEHSVNGEEQSRLEVGPAGWNVRPSTLRWPLLGLLRAPACPACFCACVSNPRMFLPVRHGFSRAQGGLM